MENIILYVCFQVNYYFKDKIFMCNSLKLDGLTKKLKTKSSYILFQFINIFIFIKILLI